MADDDQTPTIDDASQAPPEGGDAPLGPEGEKALEAFKARAREAEKEAKAAKAELEKVRIELLSGQDKAVAEAKAEGRREALEAANQRLVRSEVRALAAGFLADPDDAVHFLDLSQYEPGDDGDFDRKAIQADLAQLVKSKPYLSPSPGAGAGEGGPRGQKPAALNQDDPLLNDIKNKLGIR